MDQKIQYLEESYETTASDSDGLCIPSSGDEDVVDEDIETAQEHIPEEFNQRRWMVFQMWSRIVMTTRRPRTWRKTWSPLKNF